MNPEILTPNKELSDFVMCYWSLNSIQEDTPAKNTIIPDGTMKLIFHYGDPYKHHPNNGKSYILPKCFLIGQLTEPYIVEPTGLTGTFIVRFQPNGFIPFSTLNLKHTENTAVSIEDIYGKEGVQLGLNMLNASSNEERISIIESFLIHKLQNTKQLDHIVQMVIESIIEASGQVKVNDLSDKYNLNRRILARKFNSKVGLSPKQLSKIVRLQRTLNTLLNDKASKFTDVLYENQYFDQAHFIKDFKEFTGQTPKEFYGEDFKMSLIFDIKK